MESPYSKIVWKRGGKVYKEIYFSDEYEARRGLMELPKEFLVNMIMVEANNRHKKHKEQQMRKETVVQKEIMKFLQDNEVFCWRVNNTGVPDPSAKGGWRKQNGYNMPGMSDILGLFHGKFIAIEVKTPERKTNVSDTQQNFIDNVNLQGGVAFVASSVEDVIFNLTAYFGSTVFKKLTTKEEKK